MDCFTGVIKVILITINLVVLKAGIILTAIGGVFFSKNFDLFPEMEEYSNELKPVMLALIVVGGLLFLIGLLGCLGACTGRAGFLDIYFVVVLGFMLLECVILALAIINKDDFKTKVRTTAEDLFQKYKDKFAGVTISSAEVAETVIVGVNAGQWGVQCCGLTNGYTWWDSNGTFPPGCCDTFDTLSYLEELQGDNPQFMISRCPDDGNVFGIGCIERTSNLVDEFGTIIIAVIGGILALELFCLIAAGATKKSQNMSA